MSFAMGMNCDGSDFADLATVISRMARPTSQNLDRIERSVRFGFTANFARQSAADAGPWAALAPRTERERMQQGYPPSAPILIRSGDYMRTWTAFGGWREVEYRSNGWTMFVSSDDYRAFVHELSDRAKNIPARPVRYMDTGQMGNIASAMNDMADRVARNI